MQRTTDLQRIALQACIGLGGCAALSWEVLWQIESSLALGVSARGTAITLAITMAGMALGGLAGARWIARRPVARPTRLYGRLELLIGLAGLAMPMGFAQLEHLDAWIWRLAPALAPATHALGIALLLGAPAMAMGATVPVFALLSARYGSPLSRLYAINTAGAAIGVLAFTFAAMPALGFAHTAAVVAALNFAVCGAAHLLREPTGPGGPLPPELTARPGSSPAPRLPLLLAFGTGFVAFGLEIAWFRSLRAAFQSSADSFAIILASALIPLAIGARVAPRLARLGVGTGALFGAAGAAILLATPLVERIDLFAARLPNPVAGPNGYPIEQIGRLLLAIAILGPPMLVLGTVLPRLLDESSDPERAGALYGVNTAAAACGSLVTAWLLLPWLGSARSAWLLGGLAIAGSLLASDGRVRRAVAVAGGIALLVAVMTTSSIGRDRVQTLQYAWPSYRILAHEEGADATISVVEQGAARYLLIDGFAASGENTDWGDYMDRMGRLPMLVHGDPRAALVIGFGTGQTANGVRAERPRTLDVVELNRAVLRFAPHFTTNRDVLGDPIVRAIHMDGRAWLRRSTARYDVITLEPMPPYFAGVNALYSREFYEILAARLAPGGVACQWVPLHLLPAFYAASVTRTFQDVFADAELWVVPRDQGILLGRAPGGGRPGAARAVSSPRLALRAGREDLSDEVSVRLGPRALERYGADGAVITDDNQLLAYGRLSAEMRLYGSLQAALQLNLERIGRLAQQIPD